MSHQTPVLLRSLVISQTVWCKSVACFEAYLQLICLCVDSRTLVERLGEVSVDVIRGSTRGHDDVLKTHGRPHVGWES